MFRVHRVTHDHSIASIHSVLEKTEDAPCFSSDIGHYVFTLQLLSSSHLGVSKQLRNILVQ